MNERNLTSSDYSVVRSNEGTNSAPERGLIRRVGAYNDKLLLAEHRMEKGWVGAKHQHEHDQIVYVVSGRLTVTVGDETFAVAAGDSFVVRGGVDHQASAVEDSVVVDVFTPCRSDYL
jgi:quercetin dioxygenase-like cupin family protein